MIIYFGLLFGVCVAIALFNRLPQPSINVINGSDNFKNGRLTLFVVFLILAFFSAARDGIGVDYGNYIWYIQNIQAGNSGYMEVGFDTAILLLKHINENPRIVLIVFAFLTCFFFLRAIWDQSTDIFTSVFIFLSWGYYFFSFTNVRYYFALSLILFSVKFLEKDQHLKFITCVFITALFHKSALLCIPVYYLAKPRYSAKHIIVFIGITGALLLLKEPLRDIMFFIYPYYECSAFDTAEVSYLNILKGIVVLVLGLIWPKEIKESKLGRLYFNLNIFALIFYVGMYWTPEASRVGFYMNMTAILLIPRIIANISNQPTRYMLKFILYLFSIALFIMLCIDFLQHGTLPYKTWLTTGF